VLLSLANDLPSGATDSHFKRFQAEKVLERLKASDERDPLSRIGVFDLAWRAERHPEWAARVAAEADQLRAAIKRANREQLRFVIWAGMGGSIEDKAMYQAAGLLKHGPRLYLLDSADPAKLKAILIDIEHRHVMPVGTVLRNTLVVGMAMGMTSYEPVLNLEKLANLFERCRVDSHGHFLYMTVEGSLLDRFASERGYRKVELQLDGASTIAGRHSGPLTRGSLYPLALAGVDLRAWIDGACLSDRNIRTAWRLASFLHAQGEAGRDKVTLLLPKHWAGAAVWTKQDFEESLGKSETLGLKIVPCPKPRLADFRSPKEARQDRTFLAVAVKGMPGPDTSKISLLRRAGYPLAVLTLPRGAALSSYMQTVHYAVFGMAWLRGMDFATQPGVESYKSVASQIFAEAETVGGTALTSCWKRMAASPRQVSFRGALTLYYDRLCLDLDSVETEAPQLYAAILAKLAIERRMEYGELTWFGDTRYSPEGIAVRRSLERAGQNLFERRLKMPADVYEGPAVNHSYHEMIVGHGKCFSTVLLSGKQEQLAAARYAPDYHMAQFLATQIALAERGRYVVAIVLKDTGDASRLALEEFFHRAAVCLKPGKF
jgi:hypothetical protein